MKIKNFTLFLLFLGTILTSLVPTNIDAQTPVNSQQNIVANSITHQELQNAINDFNIQTHTGVFTTHPDYLLDYVDEHGKPIFIPYKIYNGINYVNFESAYNSATFYIDSCTVKLFDGGKITANEIPLTNSISFNLQYANNATDNWFESIANQKSCTITHRQEGNSITFDLIQISQNDVTKDIQFIFNLQNDPEAILKVTNNNQTNFNTKYGYAVSFGGITNLNIGSNNFNMSNTNQTVAFEQQTKNDLITINDRTTTLTIDPQNNLNHYLWTTKIQNQNNSLNLILDYKYAHNTLAPNHTLEIDPILSTGTGTSWSVNSDPANNDCNTYGSTNGQPRIVTPANGATGGSNYCTFNVEQFVLSGFSKQWTATKVNFNFDISPVASIDKTCSYIQQLSKPSTRAGSSLFNDIRTGLTYVTADTKCTTVSTGNSVDLGGTAVSDWNTAVQAGQNWFAVGGRFDDMEKTHVHSDESDFTNPNLSITYSWIPPTPINDLGCIDNAINSINCSWSTPNSTNPILGYYFSKNATLQQPLFTPNLIRDYRFDYYDPNYGIIDYVGLKNATFSAGSYGSATGIIGQANNFTGGASLTTSSTNIPVGTSDRSYSLWLKTPSILNNTGNIFGNGINATNNNFSLVLNKTKLLFAGGNNDRFSSTTLSPNTWYHIVATLRNSGLTRDLYINGTEDANFPYTSTALNTTTSSLLIGNGFFTRSTGAISATGGTITTSGGNTIHTFTTSGTFTVISGTTGNISILVVGGGGGGGGVSAGGDAGGGAGGVIYNATYSVTNGTHSVTVGSGGAAGSNGNNSIFETLTAVGGGLGANSNGANGGNGGSGGGAGASTSTVQSGGTATSGQGHNGGINKVGNPHPAGGGGGASQQGGDGGLDIHGSPCGSCGGYGGNGTAYSISGSSVYYGGGGGGSTYFGNTGIGGTGGLGGGGNGFSGSSTGNGFAGTANTGGGGGGTSSYGSPFVGGAGGSGIVIISYPTSGATNKIPTKSLIDDFRVYNIALTSSQVTQLYNYRLIPSSSTSYTDTSSIYPFIYKFNFAPVSSLGQAVPISGSYLTVAPYNVIDPPYKLNAQLANDVNGWYVLLNWIAPIIPNNICGSFCSPNGYQIQYYNTTLHQWVSVVNNQTALTYKLYNLNSNFTQNIRLLTNNHAGLSVYDFPSNSSSYTHLISHLYLQNNLLDSMKVNNGTMHGNWNFTTGRQGNAQVFDGSTYDELTSNRIPITTNNRTVSMWIYPKSFSSNNNAYFSYGISSTNSQFGIIDANGKIDCGGSNNNVNSTTTLSLNHWNFITCVLGKSGTERDIYINGTLDKNSTTTALNTGSSDIYIGTSSTNTNNKVNALISNIRVYDSSFSNEQVTDLYNEAMRTHTPFAASLGLTYQVVGNVFAANGTLNSSAGFPIANNIVNYKLINGSQIVQTHDVSLPITAIYHIPLMYNFTSVSNPKTYSENITVTSSTGNLTIQSNTINVLGLFTPSYTFVNGADTPNWFGQATRFSNGTINLKLLANPITFSTTCNIASTLTDNTTFNYNNVGFVNSNFNQFGSRNTVYGQCKDAPVIVFQFQLAGNQTGNAGVLVFGDVLGSTGFFGLNWTYLIILLIASTVTAKDSVIGIIATVAMIGILATTGSITNLTDLIWSAIIMLAAFGVFMGKKLFT